MRRCAYRASSSTTNSGLTKLSDFLMTQWLHLRANKRKDTWPTPSKEMLGKENNKNNLNTLRSRPLIVFRKGTMSNGSHASWLGSSPSLGRPYQHSSHQGRERQVGGDAKAPLIPLHEAFQELFEFSLWLQRLQSI